LAVEGREWTEPAPPHRARRLLALTMGEPAGIGLELTLAFWRTVWRSSSPSPCACVLYADPDAVALYADRLGLTDVIETIAEAEQAFNVWPQRVPVKPVRLARPVVPGRPDGANAGAVIAAIEQATAAVVTGRCDALVTNPIAKGVLMAAGFAYPGHTEFLGALAQRLCGGGPYRPVMMVAAAELRVVPLTVHIPLAEVPAAISLDLIVETVRIVEAALVRDFGLGFLGGGARPRIAIAGLNPHAGEDGALGPEDRDIVAPAVTALRAEGRDVTGPHSADTLFHAEARTRYDAAIAMYHDQALIPIKTLAFDRGVNVTLGLPFVRTSPDHGTAFELAGSGRANPTSLQEACALAARIATNRARQRSHD
jgi:4-hydroxythreonine-4-phosphate dehydrogenase